MPEDESKAIQKRGANARAVGLEKFDNPFYKLDQCPGTTGETLEAWQAKVDAWDLGWLCEDMMR